ncbi:MAG: hypothetical protein Q8L57_03405, partial [bacterium]|nr:hypothetical protein [bacterium]
GVLSGNYISEEILKINKTTGELAGPETPEDQIEEKKFLEIHSILFYLSKDDPLGPKPTDFDPQFKNWEEAVLKWVKSLPDSYLYNSR